MEIKEDVEGGKQTGIGEPLIGEQKNQLVHANKDHHHPWMVYFIIIHGWFISPHSLQFVVLMSLVLV